MDIKTISATLALLAGGVTLQACDDSKKPATEVDAAKDKPADKAKAKAGEGADKDADKAKAKEAAKGEMSCGEGGCGAGSCGAKKGEHKGDKEAVHAKGEAGDKAAAGDKPEGDKAKEGEEPKEDKT